MSRDQDMERFRPSASTPAREMQPAMMESTLYQLLEELIEHIDLFDTKEPHEIVKGLERQGATTWRRSINMDEDNIPKLTKPLSGVAVPLSNTSI